MNERRIVSKLIIIIMKIRGRLVGDWSAVYWLFISLAADKDFKQ